MAGLASRQRDEDYRLRRNIIGLLLLPLITIMPPVLGFLVADWLQWQTYHYWRNVALGTLDSRPAILEIGVAQFTCVCFILGLFSALLAISCAYLLKHSPIRWSSAIQRSLFASAACAAPLAITTGLYHRWALFTTFNSDVLLISGYVLFFGGAALSGVIVHFLRAYKRRRRLWKKYSRRLCPNCRYDLRGTRSARCPECGIELFWTTVAEAGS